MDDAQIVALYFDRDETALRETDAAYGALCRNIAYNITGSKEDAEECINDALLRLWNAIPPAKPDNLGAYFVTAVRHIALNLREKLHAERRGAGQVSLAFEELSPYISAPDSTERAADSRELREALLRFLGELPVQARVYFMQRYWMCLTVKEIAAQNGAGAAAVKMSLMRTRKKLKAYLTEEGLL